ncbi:MAG: chemotaxis protein CheW [Cyanobium sp.]
MPEPPALPQAAAAADPGQIPRLLLLLAVAEQLYAVDTEAVVEVIPQVMLRPISGAPPHQSGVFNFRGRVVPVVDVTQLIAGRPCAGHLSSRIIMVRHRMADGEPALLGLLAERVTDTLLKPLASFQPAEGAAAQRPFLGGVALDERGLIQLLLCDRLATAALVDFEAHALALFDQPSAGGNDGRS